MSFKITIKNKKKVQPAAIKSVVKVLFFVFLCGFTNLAAAQNDLNGLYIKDNVQNIAKEFIFHKESETQKTANKTTIYIAENALVSGLNTNYNIEIVFLKKNKLETLVSNGVPKKSIRNKTKSKSASKNQISAIPYGNLPFENKNTHHFCVAIYFSSNSNKNKQILQKTASLINVLIYEYADAVLQK